SCPAQAGHPVPPFRARDAQPANTGSPAGAGDDAGGLPLRASAMTRARDWRPLGARAMTASVDIANVTLTYRGGSGGVLALKDTSLTVGRGEFAAVVGPSGCGKSSLMKLVTGLVPPDSGDIVIFGDRVRGPVKIAGMAFQN